MGLLDDAIREHLELKRRHGADSSEISRQERELFGADPVPAPVGDPTELVAADPGAAPAAEAPELLDPAQDSPLAADPEGFDDALFPHTHELMEAAAEAAPEAAAAPAPEPAPAPVAPPAAAPVSEPSLTKPALASEPSLTKPAPAGSDAETAARSGARRLSEDELAAWRQRLSERADRLAAQRSGDAPPPPAPATPAPPAAEQPPPVWSARTPPATPPDPGVPVDFFDAGEAERAFAPEPAPEPETPDHDVLDDTPDFLEETPEHDRMWFEQKPPRDFDFG